MKSFDENALYLWAILQKLPTRFFIRCKEANEYHPETLHKFRLAAYQWLSWVAATEAKFIQHDFNIGEHHLTTRNLPVDGFCQETNEAFEFFGRFWHRCIFCHPEGGINSLNGRLFQELHQKIEEKIKLLKECGFHVRFIWEAVEVVNL